MSARVKSAGTATKRSRAEWYSRFVALRAEGLTGARIAEREGLGHSFVNSVLNDPRGEKERARKDRYRGTCEVCGKATTGAHGRAGAPRLCPRHARRANSPWDHAKCVGAIRTYHERFGVWPSAADFNPAVTRTRCSPERVALAEARWAAGEWPSPATVTFHCGSWNAAVEEAGGLPLRPGRRRANNP